MLPTLPKEVFGEGSHGVRLVTFWMTPYSTSFQSVSVEGISGM